MSTSVTLFRPIGQEELDLIIAVGMKAFPPRLDWQPIFYPVLNAPYATQIARDWNTRDDATGYVTRFAVDAMLLGDYETHQVGGQIHVEYWIPAEDLDVFNEHLASPIEVIAAYRGDPPEFDGHALAVARLAAGQDARPSTLAALGDQARTAGASLP